MFAWFVSLFMLFGSHGNAPGVPSVGLNNSGNRHVLPADDPGSNPQNPPNVDGGGKPGGP